MHAEVAEFLGKLSALMDEYDAEIIGDSYQDNYWSMIVSTRDGGLCNVTDGSSLLTAAAINKCLQEATNATP